MFAENRFASGGRAGFTLTEVAIIIGLTGFIIGAVWLASGSVGSRLRLNQAIAQLTQINSNMFALYAGQNVAGLTPADSAPISQPPFSPPADFCAQTAILAQKGVFPAEMIDPRYSPPSYHINNPWNLLGPGWDCSGVLGSVGVSLAKSPGGTGPVLFGVRYIGVPQNVCAQLLMATSMPGVDTRLLLMDVTSTATSIQTTSYKVGGGPCSLGGTCGLPISASDANTGCGSLATATIVIDWYYQLGAGNGL